MADKPFEPGNYLNNFKFHIAPAAIGEIGSYKNILKNILSNTASTQSDDSIISNSPIINPKKQQQAQMAQQADKQEILNSVSNVQTSLNDNKGLFSQINDTMDKQGVSNSGHFGSITDSLTSILQTVGNISNIRSNAGNIGYNINPTISIPGFSSMGMNNQSFSGNRSSSPMPQIDSAFSSINSAPSMASMPMQQGPSQMGGMGGMPQMGGMGGAMGGVEQIENMAGSMDESSFLQNMLGMDLEGNILRDVGWHSSNKGPWGNLMDQIMKYGKGIINSLIQFFEEVWVDIKKWSKEGIDSISEMTTGDRNKFMRGINGAWGDISKTYNKTIGPYVDAGVSKMKGMGNDFMRGYNEGIGNPPNGFFETPQEASAAAQAGIFNNPNNPAKNLAPGLTENPNINPNNSGIKIGKSNGSLPEGWGTEETRSPEFQQKLEQIANSLQMDPDLLRSAMMAESSLNPRAVNKDPRSGATGLIQWMPSTAKQFGFTTDDLLKMPATDQLDHVYEYFKNYTGKLNTPGDVQTALMGGDLNALNSRQINKDANPTLLDQNGNFTKESLAGPIANKYRDIQAFRQKQQESSGMSSMGPDAMLLDEAQQPIDIGNMNLNNSNIKQLDEPSMSVEGLAEGEAANRVAPATYMTDSIGNSLNSLSKTMQRVGTAQTQHIGDVINSVSNSSAVNSSSSGGGGGVQDSAASLITEALNSSPDIYAIITGSIV